MMTTMIAPTKTGIKLTQSSRVTARPAGSTSCAKAGKADNNKTVNMLK